MVSTVWYVEDDTSVANCVKALLEANGYAVTVFSSGSAMRAALPASAPDMLLLDWTLPGESGRSICRSIRESGSDLPIIMLTVHDDPVDVVKGIDSGADDYVAKPFDAEVLLARIRALLRRSQPATRLVCGPIVLDSASGIVTVRGETTELTALEHRLLELLMRNSGKIVSRQMISQALWEDNGGYVTDNAITVAVKRLRDKLGGNLPLRTLRSIGYRLENP